MRAGELKHRITIQHAVETQSSTSGAIIATWDTFAQRSASIESESGKEFADAKLIHAELTHLIRMRGFCSVTPKMRVLLYDGRILEILSAYSMDGTACAMAPEVWLACRHMS